MKKIIAILLFCATIFDLKAQSFVINAGEVEYEVKANFKKTLGSSTWAEMMKDKLPQFKTTYYKLTFANNEGIYKFDRWEEKQSIPEWMKQGEDENTWYTNFNTGKQQRRKNVIGLELNVEDSLQNIEWKLTNEMREIAGFNCRKAVGKIFDSVYVFAFFTNEIAFSGGPGTINGLPGLIMGLTIPRLYTSWMATKVKVAAVDNSIIKPMVMKKPFTNKTFAAIIDERTKDWWEGDNPEESKKQRAIFIWNLLL